MFLTVRPNKSNTVNFTGKNFFDIRFDYDNYSIHYTDENMISKGEYIKKNIITDDANEKYNQIIFIDDYETYIKTVNNVYRMLFVINLMLIIKNYHPNNFLYINQ